MNKKIIWALIVWSILWVLNTAGHIKFSIDYGERQSELNTKNDMLKNRIQVYEKLSDPKSVQLYVSELNKLLDNMHRLGKIIEDGEEIDKALIDISNQQQEINDRFKTVLSLEEHKAYVVQNDWRVSYNVEENKSVWERTDSLETDMETGNLSLIKKFDIIENDLRDIRNTITQIRSSKIGSKIFKK